MTLNLIKLSVGSESVADLQQWQQRYGEYIHITRNTPKRAEELLNGGSIYWVIKGWLCGRQKLLELRPLNINGIAHCGLVYAPEMIRIQPRPHRAFQGWRYLEGKDAPPDVSSLEGEDEIPEDIRRELVALGLL